MSLWNLTEQILAEADHVSLRAGVSETAADVAVRDQDKCLGFDSGFNCTKSSDQVV